MRPTLPPGVEVVATDSREAAIGDIVVLPHPDRENFWLVKRMSPPPYPIDRDKAWVLSDNSHVTKADSRSFGPVALSSLLPVVERLDVHTFVEACALLASEDAAIATALDRFGVPPFWERRPGFATLAWLICEQQVSLESGAAIFARLQRHTGTVTPETLAGLGLDGMRSLGLTRQKSAYLEALARSVLDGSLRLDLLETMAPVDARALLLQMTGVGPWTADAYLLSALRLPDIFPVGDRALQVGTAEVFGLASVPDEEELTLIGESWRPIRAAAARIIWHAYLTRRGRVEPPDPTQSPVERVE